MLLGRRCGRRLRAWSWPIRSFKAIRRRFLANVLPDILPNLQCLGVRRVVCSPGAGIHRMNVRTSSALLVAPRPAVTNADTLPNERAPSAMSRYRDDSECATAGGRRRPLQNLSIESGVTTRKSTISVANQSIEIEKSPAFWAGRS